ncbi:MULTISPECIES: ribosome silencing factor [Delftia]|uniref:Ribosomal silencing factor RsfS n=1 Tax=Delftia lacustris TaxID=558537 RepID=A0A7T3DEZ8_9BURK|nr:MULTISPECIES: ribosome silencing factor [Delftia]EPD39085.1 iojap-like ribosome-associated protein [Delftia acidovorans CCUG 15835]QPS82701.1 ribosome silencing factor [Delftia lacustris]
MTTSTKSDSAAKRDVTKLQRAIVDGLENVKAQDIQVFNTEKLSPLFERVIVAAGTSNRQTKALASSVRDAVKQAGFPVPRQEGEENGEWIIVDCGQAVVHVMQPAIRQYYRLEEIWGETPVRLKLGAPKPTRSAATDKAEEKAKKAATKKAASGAASAAAKKPAAKKAAPAKAAAPRSAAAKPAAAKSAAVKSAAAKSPAGKTAAPKAIKTVVVNRAPAKAKAGAAAKPVAKPAAKRAPRAKA